MLTSVGLRNAYPSSYSSPINSFGAFVGLTVLRACPNTDYAEAFVYSSGTVTCLGGNGQNTSGATGINDSGVIVGYSGSVPFIYSDGAFSGIPTVTGGEDLGINNAGQVVGLMTGQGGPHAFLYSGGVLTDISRLGGVASSVAKGINNNGDVVGGSPEAFLYTSGTVLNLNAMLATDIGTTLIDANAITDAGQILARGANGHPYVLTPTATTVPEPASWFLLTAGLLVISLVRSREQLIRHTRALERRFR